MKKTDDIITIIVPVYNSGIYLRPCLDSILRQSWCGLEIILVDDGSTDGSNHICDEYAKKDPRIRVIHQENRGLSAARNTGLDAATGEYLMFVDSDDEIMPDMAEELYRIMEETGADIVQCSFFEVKQGRKAPDTTEIKRNGKSADGMIRVFQGEAVMARIHYDYLKTVVQWNKLYKRHIFDGLRFPEGRFHEDEFIAHRELAAAKVLADTERRLYIYFRRPGSITLMPDMRKLCDVIEATSERAFFLLDSDMPELASKCYLQVRCYALEARISKRTLGSEYGSDDWFKRIIRAEREAKRRFKNVKLSVTGGELIQLGIELVRHKLWMDKNLIVNRIKKYR